MHREQLVLVLVGEERMEFEHLMVIFLIFILGEVRAIEVKEAMAQLVASDGLDLHAILG